MADLTPQMGGANTNFQQVSPDRGIDTGGQSAARTYEGLAVGLIQGAAKGWARGAGRQVSGVDLSHQDVESTVELFDEQVYANSPGEVSGAELEDIRQRSLSEVATTRRELDALIRADKISSEEGRARMHQLLASKLSNPFLAMYEEDFVNQAVDYTGGVGANNPALPMSPTEIRNQQLAEARAKAQAQVDELSANMSVVQNKPREETDRIAKERIASVQFVTEQAERVKMKQVVLKPQIEKVTSDLRAMTWDVFDKNLYTTGFTDSSGRLNTEGYQQTMQDLSAHIEGAKETVFNSALNDDDKKAEMARLDAQMTYFERLAKAASAPEFASMQAKYAEDITSAMFYRQYPIVAYFSNNNNPDLAKTFLLNETDKQGVLASLGFNPTQLREGLSGATFFRGGEVLGRPPIASDTNISEDDISIVNAIEKKGYGKVRESFESDPARQEHARKTLVFAAQRNPNILNRPENLKLLEEGDPEMVHAAQASMAYVKGQLRQALTAGGQPDTDAPLGKLVPRSGVGKWWEAVKTAGSSPVKTVASNLTMGLIPAPKLAASDLEAYEPPEGVYVDDSTSKAVGQLYNVFSSSEAMQGPYPTPMDAMNAYLANEYTPLEATDPVPPLDAETQKEVSIYQQRAEKAASKLDNGQLASTISEMKGNRLNANQAEVLKTLELELAKRKGTK